MRADTLRKKFLDFFKARKHKIVESDSLAPRDDPTVLFTPAGMNQFKKEFLGFNSGFKRAATAQRCLRTDDLDKVGKTAVHHTFFEMLGNFSFGDYFKKEAIAFAWEFLTGELKIAKEKLWVSVYKDDEETYIIWRDVIKVPQEKIIKLGDKENFWPSEAKEKGPNGPCGPCSEIFFDYGKESGCGRPDCSPACNCARFAEVWNLVFTQFNRQDEGRLLALPKKNIDTGMGLERLAAVMQGVRSNFETDLFRPIIKEIFNSGLHAPRSTLQASGSMLQAENLELIYAIADHIRAVVFAVYDGILPSNEARGYVVRKLIRKSALGLRVLGQEQPFLYKLVPAVAETMAGYYPELKARQENIAQVILAEEKNFQATLDSSSTLFKEKFRGFLKKQDPQAAGEATFQLYDTYGIPFELTASWLEKEGISVSKEAFDKEMAKQKTRSKSQSAMKGEVFGAKGLGADVKETKFAGYSRKNYSVKAKIIKIIKDGEPVKKIGPGEEASVILNLTPFYPESGGQVGDKGGLIKGKSRFEVSDTQKIGKVIMHIGRARAGSLKAGDVVTAAIDAGRRLSIARNHTATHLLQAALRKVLGLHVRQQGSLVAEDKLRFDFTHFKDIDKEQLDRIEAVVNDYVMGNHSLSVKHMPLAEAKKTRALAFFGEKYESKARVVFIGDFSKEFCAGAHLDSTGSVGLFKIIREGSVASGIRRIEAVTANYAYAVIKEEEALLGEVAAAWKVPPEKIRQEQEKRDRRLRELEKQSYSQKLGTLEDFAAGLVNKAEAINNVNVIAACLDNSDMDSLRKAMDIVKARAKNALIALGSQNLARSEAFLVIGLSADLAGSGWDASALIRDIASLIGGSGGGRKDFAQAGGNKPENLKNALEELKNKIRGRQ